MLVMILQKISRLYFIVFGILQRRLDSVNSTPDYSYTKLDSLKYIYTGENGYHDCLHDSMTADSTKNYAPKCKGYWISLCLTKLLKQLQ